MHKSVYVFLMERPDLQEMIRENPYWYRLLSRDPANINKIVEESKVYYGKTFSQRMDRMNHQIQMAQFLFQMLQGMGNNNAS